MKACVHHHKLCINILAQQAKILHNELWLWDHCFYEKIVSLKGCLSKIVLRERVETHEIKEKPRFQNFQSISILRETLWNQENLMIIRLDAILIILNITTLRSSTSVKSICVVVSFVTFVEAKGYNHQWLLQEQGWFLLQKNSTNVEWNLIKKNKQRF